MEYHRRTIRLKGFDYTKNGYYFVTICAQMHTNLFWKNEKQIQGDRKSRPYTNNLNDVGQMVNQIWLDLPKYYNGLKIDEFVVMPNHVHGIIIIKNVGAGLAPAQIQISLGKIVGEFKSRCTVKYLKYIKTNKFNLIGKIWQRNYFERIIRSEEELEKIREYIKLNPENL